MRPTPRDFRTPALLPCGLFLVTLLLGGPALAQDPVVTAAVPDMAEQATYDLVVTISGNYFGTDSAVDFYVTGTTDPGGIAVKKVRRKNAKTLEATIDVSADAQTQNRFDIQVRTGGRTGKGTELFKVLVRTPKPGTADPEMTFMESSRIQVSNRDGSNKVTVYSNKNAYLRHPRMSPDRRSVVFTESPNRGGVPRIRRATLSVSNGNITVGGTETLFEGDQLGSDVALHPFQADGTRLAFFLADGIYELWRQRDCPTAPCVLADVDLLYQSPNIVEDPLAGYTANGRAFYFQEIVDVEPWLVAKLVRLEFGETLAVREVLDLPSKVSTLQASRIDYSAAPYLLGPYETRILFETGSPEPYEAELRTFDTWSWAVSETLKIGHCAVWSPNERELLYINHWQNASNWIRGTVNRFSRDTATVTMIDDFSGDPDWAPSTP